jgi:hypothetical protein
MKKILTILMLCGVCYGYAQNTPRFAASTRTWTFGNQTWSDFIRIPECNKTSFTDSYTDPHCRSYTSGANTWFYYTWPYVAENADKLCPSPWRVPTKADFEILAKNVTGSQLASAWGLPGYAYGSSMYNVGTYGRYWSSTELDSTNAYRLNYYSGGLYVSNNAKYYGYQVRCVK